MKKNIYIIGHRNPDSDSIISAASYACLKQAQGHSNCYAVRAGKLSPQTEYIFNRFGVEVPEYIPDLIPKAQHYIYGKAITVNSDVTIWEALERMQKKNLRVMPVVDADGRYKCMLNYNIFAQYVITTINPNKKAAFPVSVNHLVSTLRAQAITLFDNEEVKRSPIMVAASYNNYFKTRLETQAAENTLIVMGDRWDLQEYCIRKKVRALILSGGNTLAPGLLELAKENRVSVISTPYDTSFTSMLVMYSAPVSQIGDTSVPLVNKTDTIKKIRAPLAKAPSRCLPVGDDEGRVIGVLFENDLIEEPNVEIIMVDHNEPAQAIEGIENYKILEVIDHHRLGNLSTKYPITFINKVVGATCTIITNLYREQLVPIEKNIASILLCGILADTLSLQSATTTDVDRETADYLAAITGLNIAQLSQDIRQASNSTRGMAAGDLIALDMKSYKDKGVEYSVSQIETTTPDEMVFRTAELIEALETERAKKDMLFCALLVTDVTVLDSLLFVAAKRDFLLHINFPKLEEGVYLLKEIVSRKKQLIPLLSELVEEAG
ncbi:MAG: putative manganese-dependent inorganic diphosphatase [Spirochaetaceae bacterium]|jgi:manganese-dependent inorganic pyrophosphatase|nr:putative manganese-dependent inorganic diphosphatase [Spirochaetaceae bacterium]